MGLSLGCQLHNDYHLLCVALAYLSEAADCMHTHVHYACIHVHRHFKDPSLGDIKGYDLTAVTS